MKIVCAYNEVNSNSSVDELDVINQVNEINKSLKELGHKTYNLPVSLNLKKITAELVKIKPDLVFNLVESLEGNEAYMHFAPAVFEKLNIKYTGGSSENLFITTNKILTKAFMKNYLIPTPKWIGGEIDSSTLTNFPIPCIIKPISEDASVGIDDNAVIRNRKDIISKLNFFNTTIGSCFIEEFIDGREFNLALMDTSDGVVLLPIAEIKFNNYPKGRNKIVDYKAKWEEDSFEYKNTPRNFDFSNDDSKLLKKLEKVALKCWEKFNLKGYARVDFRVDQNGNVFVLEINSNPCISPDSGFVAAIHKYGWSYTRMVDEFIKVALEKV